MKILGITGFPPLFVSKLQGYLDAKNGMVSVTSTECDAFYIRKKLAAGQAGIEDCFLELEKNTKSLFEESHILCMQYFDNEEKLKEPDFPIFGKTIETRRRNQANVENRKPALKQKNLEIICRLAAIDEQLTDELVKTSKTKEKVFSLIERRICAYLRGASKVLKVVPDFQIESRIHRNWEEDYLSAHQENNQIRKDIISVEGGKNDDSTEIVS